MSIRTLNGIKTLVEPFLASWDIRPSGDDGLHLTGYDKAGTYHEFASLTQALNFANEQRAAQS